MALKARLLFMVSAIITQIVLCSTEELDTLNSAVNKDASDEDNPENSCEYNCPITLNCTEWSHCAFHYPDLCEGTLRCAEEEDDNESSTRRKPMSSLLLKICIPFIFFIILLQIVTQKGFMLLNLDGAGIAKAKLQRIQELNRVTVCKEGKSDIKTKQ